MPINKSASEDDVEVELLNPDGSAANYYGGQIGAEGNAVEDETSYHSSAHSFQQEGQRLARRQVPLTIQTHNPGKRVTHGGHTDITPSSTPTNLGLRSINENNPFNNDLSRSQSMNNRSTTERYLPSSRSIESSFYLTRMSGDQTGTKLSHDTFLLMMTTKPCSRGWLPSGAWGVSLGTVGVQIILLSLILAQQFSSSIGSAPFDVPYAVTWDVRFAQWLSLFIIIGKSDEIIITVKEFYTLCDEENWHKVVAVADDKKLENINHERENKEWYISILLPCCLKLVEGLLVTFVTFVIMIQSDDIVELFKDFAAMYFLSDLDNITFSLVHHGYFGSKLQLQADRAKKTIVRETEPPTFKGIAILPCIFSAMLVSMGGYFLHINIGQINGAFFELKYPNCGISAQFIPKIGDGQCDYAFNNFQCIFDGNDCLAYNIAYPNCDSKRPMDIGNGDCQDEYNLPACGYDGGDCCKVAKNDKYLEGDGNCHAGYFNTQACGSDKGDCNGFLERYPRCPEVKKDIRKNDGSVPVIGDGICDFISSAYMSDELCGKEDGDCTACIVDDWRKLGDGKCDGGKYNTAECNFDFGDCDLCKAIVDDIHKVGDGHCDGREYMSIDCNYDGGDCDGCNVPDRFKIGDGRCDYRYEETVYNRKACSWDGGDCNNRYADLVRKYPDCEYLYENRTLLGNGHCDAIFDNTECGLDDDDCRCDDPIFDQDGDGRC